VPPCCSNDGQPYLISLPSPRPISAGKPIRRLCNHYPSHHGEGPPCADYTLQVDRRPAQPAGANRTPFQNCIRLAPSLPAVMSRHVMSIKWEIRRPSTDPCRRAVVDRHNRRPPTPAKDPGSSSSASKLSSAHRSLPGTVLQYIEVRWRNRLEEFPPTTMNRSSSRRTVKRTSGPGSDDVAVGRKTPPRCSEVEPSYIVRIDVAPLGAADVQVRTSDALVYEHRTATFYRCGGHRK